MTFLIALGAVLTLGAGALAGVFLLAGPRDLAQRQPVEYPVIIPEGEGPGPDQGEVTTGPGQPATDAWGTWPAFRGPELDLVSREGIDLLDSWGPDGPPVLWKTEVGEGFAAPAAFMGKLYLLDYDVENEADVLRCLSLADGKEIWRHAYPAEMLQNYGYTRTVPAVTEKYVVTISPKCYVLCVEAETGKYLWHRNLLAEYRTQEPSWYSAQCPIIDDGKAIIAPAGTKMMIAVDLATGQTLWEAENPRRWKMTHTSITPMTFAGRKMYVYAASGGVVGVSAEDGQVLWEHPGWIVPTANIPCPVVVGEDKIFLTGGYGAGSRMLQLVEDSDGSIRAREVYSLRPRQFSSYQQTPVYYKGYLYTVLTQAAGSRAKQLACMSPEGQIVWTSGSDHLFGWGPYLVADEKILLMDDEGVLTMAAASPSEFRVLGRAQPFGGKGKKTWGPMTLIGGRLLCRDMDTLICVDLRKN
jgi:outer membrane protein assembly factor BamB